MRRRAQRFVLKSAVRSNKQESENVNRYDELPPSVLLAMSAEFIAGEKRLFEKDAAFALKYLLNSKAPLRRKPSGIHQRLGVQQGSRCTVDQFPTSSLRRLENAPNSGIRFRCNRHRLVDEG